MSTHYYKALDIDTFNEAMSNFIISSWSYSKVTSFARHEKNFEKENIYGLYSRSSAITVAGQAYHHALKYYFAQKKEGKTLDIVELEASAFQYIDNVPANRWKIQKTTPTIEECQLKANSVVTALLNNFLAEIAAYESDVLEILDVEVYCDEFLTINGVDIPLPCHCIIDLVVKTTDGKTVIIDHKSKNAFTDESEAALSIGTQAITYVKCYEEKNDLAVDEVWFIENKYSKNKDKSAQLSVIRVTMDENTRRLYEALLYEPLKRMIEAVSNPDYVYLINEADNFVDMAEIYDFWARTMICEVEDFNVEESKKELVAQRLKKIRDSSIQTISPAVIKTFKENASKFIQYDLSNKNMTPQEKIEHVLRSFNIITRVAYAFQGYSSTTFLLEVSAGVKVASVQSRRLDLANALDVANVRISNEMVVHENRSFLAVEYTKRRDEVLNFDPSLLQGMKIPLGKDNFDHLVIWDLENQSTPHVLICGATGSGKSVCVRSIIEYAKLAEVDNIIIFDPKYEFTHYDGDNGIVVVSDILQIEEEMAKLVNYMNDLVRKGTKNKKTLVVFDEFADAVANARKGNELKIYEQKFDGYYANGNVKQKRECTGELNSLEQNLKILLQKGRSSGFRVIAATQRASVKVITGDAKANLPVRICFQLPTETDSKVVLDEPGAEALAGKGDGLIKSPEYKSTVRFQAFYKPETVTA